MRLFGGQVVRLRKVNQEQQPVTNQASLETTEVKKTEVRNPQQIARLQNGAALMHSVQEDAC